MELVLILQFLCIILLLLDVAKSLRDINDNFSLLSGEYVTTNNEVIPPKSSYEIEKEERERIFDERIRQLQDELGQASPKTTGIEAEILAKGIYNIPHNEVKAYSTPAIEIAD